MQGQSETALQAGRQVQPKTLISAEAKKLLNLSKILLTLTYNSLWHIFTSTYDWLCHFATYYEGQSQSYVLVKICYKLHV